MAQEPRKPGTELGRSLGPMFLSQLFSLTWFPHPRGGQAPVPTYLGPRERSGRIASHPWMGACEGGPPICPLLSSSLKAKKCPVDAHFMSMGLFISWNIHAPVPLLEVPSVVLKVHGHTIHHSPSDALRLIKAEPLYCDGGEAASGFLLARQIAGGKVIPHNRI